MPPCVLLFRRKRGICFIYQHLWKRGRIDSIEAVSLNCVDLRKRVSYVHAVSRIQRKHVRVNPVIRQSRFSALRRYVLDLHEYMIGGGGYNVTDNIEGLVPILISDLRVAIRNDAGRIKISEHGRPTVLTCL